MATAAQVTLIAAVTAAAGAKQAADAAAFAAYGFVAANLAAYAAALVTNRLNYVSAVVTAATTAGVDPSPFLYGPWASISASVP